MVTTSESKAIIEIEHMSPEDFIKDLKKALINGLQNQELSEYTDLEVYRDTQYVLIELLKQLEK